MRPASRSNTPDTGNDYMKASVDERFSLKDGKATWKNRTEEGDKAVTAPAFYVPTNAPPEFFGVLARALLKAPNHTLPLLPAGEAHIDKGASATRRRRQDASSTNT